MKRISIAKKYLLKEKGKKINACIMHVFKHIYIYIHIVKLEFNMYYEIN